MVRGYAEIYKEQFVAARLRTTALWLHCHKNSIDLLQSLRIVNLQYPSLVRNVVHIKDAQAYGFFVIRATSAPRLKRIRIRHPRLLVKVVGIENERLVLGKKYSAKGFFVFPVARNIVDFGKIKISSPHQFTNVAVGRQQLLLLRNRIVAAIQEFG